MRGKRLAGLAALALLIRLAPAPFSGHGWDLYVWLRTSELFLKEQINIYEYPQLEGFPWGFYAYPPPWLYILAAFYHLSSLLGGDRALTILLIKTPVIAADVLCGLVLWFSARQMGLDDEKSFRVAAAYLLNPVTIFISSVWGMFDALPALFTLLSLQLLLSRRVSAAAVSLGLAASFKIYPAILLPSILTFLRKKSSWRRVLTEFLPPFVLAVLLVSAPFLNDISSFLEKITYHRSNIGQFTYWALLGIFLGGELSSIAGWILFVSAMGIYLYKQNRGEIGSDRLAVIFAGMFTLFLATSPKINVQYLVLGLPLLLLAAYSYEDGETRKEIKRRLIMLHLAAIVFIAGSFFVIGYDPSNMGKVYNLSLFEAGLAGFVILAAAGIAGWESVKLSLALSGLTSLKRKLDERAGITIIVVVALIVVTVLPSPAGVRLPAHPVRVAVLESPDSIFQPGSTDIPSELYRNLAEPTHIVIPLSPDFYMNYGNLRPSSTVSGYFRFRLDSGGWTLRDLSSLVLSLKESRISVLAGVFTVSKELLISYGMQGFESSWFRERSYLVHEDDRLGFGIMMPENVSLAGYYSRQISLVVESMGFDGVFILTPPKGLVSSQDIDWIEPLLLELRAELDGSKKIFLDGVDPALGGDAVKRLSSYADFIVFRSPTWFREITSEEPRLGLEFIEQLGSVMANLTEEERLKTLYSINSMDFSSGWLVPALQVQLQVDTLSPIVAEGFVIYYASRYIPYRLTLDTTHRERLSRG